MWQAIFAWVDDWISKWIACRFIVKNRPIVLARTRSLAYVFITWEGKRIDGLDMEAWTISKSNILALGQQLHSGLASIYVYVGLLANSQECSTSAVCVCDSVVVKLVNLLHLTLLRIPRAWYATPRLPWKASLLSTAWSFLTICGRTVTERHQSPRPYSTTKRVGMAMPAM